jgi:hypothetical protein
MASSLNKVCNSVVIVVHALASYLCLCVSFRHLGDPPPPLRVYVVWAL